MSTAFVLEDVASTAGVEAASSASVAAGSTRVGSGDSELQAISRKNPSIGIHFNLRLAPTNLDM